ncbi:family 78 glycoside hydrolase catalytic domain [Pedobacter psychroterrae]|uniref:alpha-L-rhamnosidase n=1 Tax=Pedobacter psychroterrae TaxID=2530453 RepID=A0A4R0NNL6_9SPHI|nr:family 78 glycoside hydrolase catalytic domain [Pedobacter psychroterrae]TCD01839.1 alpha-L-rhamnosidase [Pedobacter psychroterrae]
MLLQLGSLHAAGKTGLKTDRLTCEYMVNPLGIEVLKPRLSWTLLSSIRNQQQTAYELIVSDNLTDIKRMKGTTWNTGKVASSQSVHVAYDGSPLKPFTRYYWRVKVYSTNGASLGWSELQWFETAMLNASDWQGKWIGDGSKQFEKDEDFYKNDPMPLLRKTINAEKNIASARLYISGLGYYEAFVNGKKVGDHVLDPGWTSYSKQVLYCVYDITPHMKKGLNAAGIMLGNGWYNPLPLRFWGGINMRDALVSGKPCVKAMIRIQYTDGSTSVVPTDESWQTTSGPIIRNSIFLGEHHDARAEKENWNTIKANTSDWKNAVAVEGPKGTLSPQMQPPIRVTKIIKPISVNEIKPGVFIFDMGQNFAGVARFRVKGPAGTEVKVRYGEDKYADGSLNVMTAVAGQIKGGNGGPGAPHIAWQEDSYILKGSGIEEWSAKFTFHGFRFMEVTGWPGKPGLSDIEGLRMSADLQESGTFSSSNDMFNKLDTNIKFTFLSNAFSVQSDCPGREKLGYGGDLFCTTESFMYHYDMAGFYRKIVKDFTDDQQPLGGITETVPFVGIADAGPGDKSGPLGFQVGFPYLIKKIHDFYGDKRLIEENYSALTKHIKFLESSTKDNLFTTDLGDHESLDDRSIPLTASIFYYLHARMMNEFAGILEKRDDETRYAALAETIQKAIVNKYYDAGSGKFEKGSQTTQIFALWSNIEKEGTQSKVIAALVAEFEKKNWHLSTGIFGTKMLFDVLRKSANNEMAYRIANQRDFPGWGYMIANGATTVWETWAASDNTFSKNHPMFGSVGEWFYRSLLGINSAAPGFKKMVIKPQPAGDLKHAEGSYTSPYGKIGSSWVITDQQFKLNVEIPVNTTAEIWVPLKYGEQITESGKSISAVEGVVLQRKENGYAVIQAGSGIYSFVASK